VTSGLLNALVAEDLPGPGTVFLGVEWRFLKAVGVGEELVARAEVLSVRADKPICTLATRIVDGAGETCLEGTATTYTVPLATGTTEAGARFRSHTLRKESRNMAEKKLSDLFYDGLKDIYYAERKILKALPKMARGAQSEELKAAFKKHQEETEGHVERLQKVFEIFGKRAQGKTCPAIDGILEEGEEILDEFKGAPALDAGLVSAAQAVEHYEIARYGTLKRWAETLKLPDAAKLLDQTLQEESKTDEALSALAESDANIRAAA
jgi:ferritin-like metal-binding protein YciE